MKPLKSPRPHGYEEMTNAERSAFNRGQTKELERCVRDGEPYPGAVWFYHMGGLRYGFADTMKSGCLGGLYVTVASLEDDEDRFQIAALRRIAKILNAWQRRRVGT